MKVRVNNNGQSLKIGDFVLIPVAQSGMPLLIVIRGFSKAGDVLGLGLTRYRGVIGIAKVSTNFGKKRCGAWRNVLKVDENSDLKYFLSLSHHSSIYLLQEVSKNLKESLDI